MTWVLAQARGSCRQGAEAAAGRAGQAAATGARQGQGAV